MSRIVVLACVALLAACYLCILYDSGAVRQSSGQSTCDLLRAAGVELRPTHYFGKAPSADCSKTTVVRFANMRVRRDLLDLTVELPSVNWIAFSKVTCEPGLFAGLAKCGQLRRFAATESEPIKLEFASLPTMPQVVKVQLASMGTLTALHLRSIAAAFPSIDSLYVHYSQLDDEACTVIGGMSHLKHLHFARSGITSKGLEMACRLGRLESLGVSGEQLSDADWSTIVGLSKLSDVYCSGGAVPESISEELKVRGVRIIETDL